MESQKIYLSGTPNGDTGLNAALVSALQNKGVDPNVLALLNRGGDGLGFGNGNDLLGLLILFAIFGGNGFGGWGGNANNGASTAEREMIMSAIQRNGLDVNTLATTLNCSVGQINSGINALAGQIGNLASQNGQSAMQIINSIQAGNQTLSAQLAQCCCDQRLLTTQLGYDNQIATLNQTNQLGTKIDANTLGIRDAIAQQSAMINDKFCSQEMREMQNKIDALREERSSLQSTLAIAQQTANIQASMAAAVNPLGAAVSELKSELAGIKCRMPETIPVQADRGLYLNQCALAALGYYGAFRFPSTAADTTGTTPTPTA